MIEVTLLVTRFHTDKGMVEAQARNVAFLAPERIDTVTRLCRQQCDDEKLPRAVSSVIRYLDVVHGYRLLFVTQSADEVARARMKALRGEDPSGPDFQIEAGS